MREPDDGVATDANAIQSSCYYLLFNVNHTHEGWSGGRYVGPFRSREAALAYLMEECDTAIVPGMWLKQDVAENGPVDIAPPRAVPTGWAPMTDRELATWRSNRDSDIEDDGRDRNR